MDLCDATVAKQIGKCLSDYLRHIEVESQNAKRKEELQAIIRDKSLNKVERAKKMEEVKQKYLQLSARAASGKHQNKLQSIPSRGLQAKKAIYNEAGELKHWDTDSNKKDDAKSIHQQFPEKGALKQQRAAMYSETGELKQWSDVEAKMMEFDAGSQRKEYFGNTFVKRPSIDSQRRDELQGEFMYHY